ncbi:preprotein translocase subunit SecD [Achromobacter sp. Marseille-Q0513]|uniref:SecDF P1 head subdomain-containing protein n=1 Tax=Achromobacter sp. Marseille-Q0513 TaxID=2829161 RepID=UPI001B9ABD52|nr:preprotein translocase subunit SecD [Achromobacter sp. Marseille-Q0513]MBR8655728.1 preprotein translocase subunit SecD [Achromobacter sp. Marseille-Q0513]
MQLTLRNMAPALMVLTLALAGCKTAPTKNSGDAAATPQAGQQQQQQQQSPSATASVVEFYVARTQAGPGLTEVTLPDGKLYMEQQPVLTRADLTEAAQLVDREGNNFVGLRFSESGARKLNDISSKNVGNMLVLVLDRELIAAPRIGEPLNRGVLAFGVPSAKAAADIASRIRGDSSAPAAGGSPATAPVTAPAAKP